MNEHPIHQLLDISLDKVIQMIDTQKIVGQPINLDSDRVIIPISKVSFGFGAGGSEFDAKNQKKGGIFNTEASNDLFPFGGGSGGGVAIQPLAFIVVDKEKVNIIYSQRSDNLYDKVFDFISQFTSSKEGKNSQ